MESTGSYWIPVKNILEDSVQITLVCARKHKPERGDKTDFRDAKNLAHLHRHGLLKGSFLPDRNIVELRDLTRRRKKLLGNLRAVDLPPFSPPVVTWKVPGFHTTVL
jgi:transposase